MTGAFWNIRGLNKTGRIECFKDFVTTNELDFIFRNPKKTLMINPVLILLGFLLIGTFWLLVVPLEVS